MMEFLKKLFFGGAGSSSSGRRFAYRVKCKRCGEIIEGYVDTSNDLSVEYEGSREIFHVRKVLIGDGSTHCYQQIEVELKFNTNRELIEKSVVHGEFVE